MTNKTHAELVKQGERWLRSAGNPSLMTLRTSSHLQPARCGVVLCELTSRACETPDVIGWREGFSVLLEIKTSRSDYYRDRAKGFRAHPERGMGNYRFFLAQKGLLDGDNLPDNWGLLEVVGRSVKVVRPAVYQKCDYRNERLILTSALRRSQQRDRGQV